MRINPVLADLGTYPLAEVQERARRLREEGRPLIDFSIGDPREPTPGFIRAALADAIPEVSQYPTTAGLPELRAAIAAYVGRRFGVEIDPDTQVLPTSGAKEAIFSTPLAFVDRHVGEAVVYGTPAYPVYERGARFAGAWTLPVELRDDFVLRAGDVPDESWDRARLLWMCSPHNPTGSVTDAEEMAALVTAARSTETLLLSDECYSDLYEDQPPPSVLEVAAGGQQGVLAYLSCSKRSGMTGYRSGAIVGDAEAIAALRRFRSTVGTASPEFVQAAAVAAWSDDDHAAARRQIFTARRQVLREGLESMGVRVVGSQAGLYVWAEVGDGVEAASRLLDEGVVVAPGEGFGPGGERFIRLALIPSVDECRAALEVLERCLS